MNIYKILFVLLLLGLLFNGMASNKSALAQTDSSAVADTVVVYTPGEGESPVPSAFTGNTDLVHQGTAWVRELTGKFAVFRPYGWGTLTRVKAAGDYWVHIPVPYASVIDGQALKFKYAEVCGYSSNGAATKPIKLDLWQNTIKIGSWAITWPADNNYHCAGVSFGTPEWKDSVGISVLLRYANTTDTITLAKAWIRLVP
jgi:hypothetical protein